MTDHFREIYATQAARYDAMVQREDHAGNLLPALRALHPLDGATVVEFGAGTGRLTRLLSPLVGRVFACDIAPAMLEVAAESLAADAPHVFPVVADNRALPVKTGCADVAIAGWSFGHFVDWYGDSWRAEIGQCLAEMRRVLAPDGVAIILETLGTGSETPSPPTPGLALYYDWLEAEHGFTPSWIRTDYRFASVDEADSLTRFFFGDALADSIRRESLVDLPECTGVWSQQIGQE